eukprot:TRINITY_DN907_c2_g1_i1.p1 TRINITY_DN907_c2_g1~~TRINITY_DN907_c2_g1_i1.p1  ORF type:complete len:626 (-),score=114.24 TRINITY_DN907_c2_g1_i1:450-2327(-)
MAVPTRSEAIIEHQAGTVDHQSGAAESNIMASKQNFEANNQKEEEQEQPHNLSVDTDDESPASTTFTWVPQCTEEAMASGPSGVDCVDSRLHSTNFISAVSTHVGDDGISGHPGFVMYDGSAAFTNAGMRLMASNFSSTRSSSSDQAAAAVVAVPVALGTQGMLGGCQGAAMPTAVPVMPVGPNNAALIPVPMPVAAVAPTGAMPMTTMAVVPVAAVGAMTGMSGMTGCAVAGPMAAGAVAPVFTDPSCLQAYQTPCLPAGSVVAVAAPMPAPLQAPGAQIPGSASMPAAGMTAVGGTSAASGIACIAASGPLHMQAAGVSAPMQIAGMPNMQGMGTNTGMTGMAAYNGVSPQVPMVPVMVPVGAFAQGPGTTAMDQTSQQQAYPMAVMLQQQQQHQREQQRNEQQRLAFRNNNQAYMPRSQMNAAPVVSQRVWDVAPPAFGNQHQFHNDCKQTGAVSVDGRHMTKQSFKGRLSLITEDEVHCGGKHHYLVQFTGGELSSADGVGFVFSSKLPCSKNIQRIISIFVNRAGRVCLRANAEIVKFDVGVKYLEVGDWIGLSVDLDGKTADFTVWPQHGGRFCSANFDFGAVLKDLESDGRISRMPEVLCGHLTCVVKNLGVSVMLGS